MNSNGVAERADILVVEDNPADLKLLSDILSGAGYKVRPACDGELALRSVKIKRPAMVLLDVMLPDMQGYEVCQRLQEAELTRDIPVIFISARHEAADKMRAIAVGGRDFVEKPFQAEDILARIRTHLRLYASEMTLRAAKEYQQKNAANLAALIENTDGSVWSVDRRYRLIVGNRAFRAGLAAWGGAAAAGETALPEKMPAEDRAQWQAYYDRALRGESFSVEMPVGPPADARILEYRFHPITGDGQMVIGATVFGRDVTERKHAEEQVRISLAEKNVLLRELDHRTTNNMQIICALLSLQADELPDAEARRAFKEMEDRVRAMSLAQQKIYQSQNILRINLREYMIDLADQLLQSYPSLGQQAALQTDEMQDAFISIDLAISCGLVLYELISNSLKYAFPGGRAGAIRLGLSCTPAGEITLEVADNGVGLPAGLDWRQATTLGLASMRQLVEYQLKGQVEMDSRQGVRCQIRFRGGSDTERR